MALTAEDILRTLHAALPYPTLESLRASVTGFVRVLEETGGFVKSVEVDGNCINYTVVHPDAERLDHRS